VIRGHVDLEDLEIIRAHRTLHRVRLSATGFVVAGIAVVAALTTILRLDVHRVGVWPLTLLLTALTPFVFRALRRRNEARVVALAREAGTTMELSLDAEGVHARREHVKHFSRWAAFDSFEETEHDFVLRGRTPYVLPKRAFARAEAVRELLASVVSATPPEPAAKKTNQGLWTLLIWVVLVVGFLIYWNLVR